MSADNLLGTTTLGLLGVPSSAAAHWPGQEKAPAALRDAGLIRLLREAGLDLEDHGDRPVVRWRPHPTEQRPHNLSRVLDVLSDARAQISRIVEAGQIPLVLGGECTLAIALYSAAVAHDEDVALLYFDGGQDLSNDPDNPEGVLDGIGVGHLLDRPGMASALAGFGPRRPLLSPERLCFFGYGEPEEDPDGLVPSPRFPAGDVRADPRNAARRALAALAADRFVVHFDVDVIDFYDLPVADVPLYNKGLTTAEAMTALSEIVAHPGFAGMTFAEFNPDHGEPDGSTARVLAEALTGALRPLAGR
ncbi:arginase family protein [Actinopolymorpha sp. B17G11]|uniref:arginase family protein n=1 Tax=Actinopolymorpha sp. B17G11 TaxID=3160861 RepID=UPI0032E37A33